MQQHFVIDSWAVWPPADMTAETLLQGQKEILQCVPKSLKRRLTPLAKTVFCAMIGCTEDLSLLPLVFSSTHGELAKSLAMMETIETGEEISPTAFSLSVHNAIAGLFTIAFNNKKSCTVLASGEAGITAAFIEALGLFHDGENEVLIVFYDEPLPDFFPSTSYHLSSNTLAMALKLSRQGTGQKIQFSPSFNSGKMSEQAIQLPLLIEFLSSQQSQLDLYTARQSWHWQKYD